MIFLFLIFAFLSHTCSHLSCGLCPLVHFFLPLCTFSIQLLYCVLCNYVSKEIQFDLWPLRTFQVVYSQLFGLITWILWLMASFLQNYFLSLFQNSQAGIWYCGMFPVRCCRLLSLVLWRFPVAKDHSENHNYLLMMSILLFLLSFMSINNAVICCGRCLILPWVLALYFGLNQ